MLDVTQILTRIETGDSRAIEELFPVVYDELRRIAAAQLSRERPGHTLQATALVNEAYLRLMGGSSELNFANRRYFFAAAAEAMRRILVDQARRKKRDKHGGGRRRVDLPDLAAKNCQDEEEELLALDAALPRLAEEDPLAAEIVKLKYFTGLGREEIALTLGQSVHEVRKKWTYARAWLRIALEE